MSTEIIPSHLTFNSLANSNMPAAQKSAIRRWYESQMAGNSMAAVANRAKLHATAAVEGVRAGGESIIVGGALGALAATHGLDYQKKFPIDAGLGIAALAASAAAAHTPYAGDARNAGTAALAVFGFRKTYGVLAELQRKNGKTPVAFAGDDGGDDTDFGAEDPIISAARHL